MKRYYSYDKLYKQLERVNINKCRYLISIVIPVYNEEKTIYSILKSLPENDKIEIIVIDDKSVDNSIREIEKAQKNHSISLYKHEKNRGYGKAILTGIKKSQGKVIITMDSDGQHSPDDIYILSKPILEGKAHYTIGSRYLGSYHYELPMSTRFGEVVVEKLIHIFFGQKVVNNQGGFRAFDRDIIHIFDDIQYKNFAFTTELIIRALLYKYKIIECPIKLVDRSHGSSRIKLNKLGINISFCLFRYFLIKIKMRVLRKYTMSFKKHKLIFKELS